MLQLRRPAIWQPLLGLGRQGACTSSSSATHENLMDERRSSGQACSSSTVAGPPPPGSSSPSSPRPARLPWTPSRQLDKQKVYPKRMRHLISVRRCALQRGPGAAGCASLPCCRCCAAAGTPARSTLLHPQHPPTQSLESEYVAKCNQQRQLPSFRSGDILEVQVVRVLTSGVNSDHHSRSVHAHVNPFSTGPCK